MDERLERPIPVVAEVDVVMRRAGRRQTLHTGNPQQAARRVLASSRHPRCVDSAEQRAVGDGEVGIAHDGVGGHTLTTAELDTGHAAIAGPEDACDG